MLMELVTQRVKCYSNGNAMKMKHYTPRYLVVLASIYSMDSLRGFCLGDTPQSKPENWSVLGTRKKNHPKLLDIKNPVLYYDQYQTEYSVAFSLGFLANNI
ncbi:hypothetical protein O181_067441 [Austropuccinia psidii MF-1]|uniref:Uncharacterized protein n=1 Tax=Austropuccinia psidii MF-1 TaxID=1389203 RepID=A0A9Q3I324_9BASI|nr:hypothetical protein [Austropuccinia psidii MF-1]